MLAALFTPTKYGLLPDHLGQEELPAGNALVEAATFLAILLGTIVGGIAAAGGGNPVALTVDGDGLLPSSPGSSRGPIPRNRRSGARISQIDRNIFRSTGDLDEAGLGGHARSGAAA